VSLTHPNSTPAYSKLIGTPYEKRDCWGVAVDFYQIELNIKLLEYYSEIPETRDNARDMIYSCMKDFKKVEDRQYGDLILIKLYGIECHIGIYLGNGQMLHTTSHSGCVIDRLIRWEKLIVGFYRVKHD